MDLTPENVQAVFLDSLALDAEGSPSLRVRGLSNEYVLNVARLGSHRETVRGFLSRVSTLYYADRGGGHSCFFLSRRRDGVDWGARPDMERLLALGLGLDLIEFCFKRGRWDLFPRGMPYVRLRPDLYRLWAVFRCPVPAGLFGQQAPFELADSVSFPFDAEAYPPPTGFKEEDWYCPAVFRVSDVSSDPAHVAEAFYNAIIVEGFFDDSLPSWVLDPEATLQVY